MIGIASRFRPWGRPFQPYDLSVEATEPGDLTDLSKEEGTEFNGPPVVLTNNSPETVITFATALVDDTLSNLVTDGIINATGTLEPGQSQTITPKFRPPDAGAFSATFQIQLRLTAYAAEAWTAHNSADTEFLQRHPAYKVSRSVILTPSVTVAGSAYPDN